MIVAQETAEDEMFQEADRHIHLSEIGDTTNLESAFVVVCTQGENDALSLEHAINLKPKYLAFVSSRKKANAIYRVLKSNDVTVDQLKTIRTPAGLDIMAKTPQEVAISILAEIIQTKRSLETKGESPVPIDLSKDLDDNIYINPVCKIPVLKDAAMHILEYKGEKVYFCCDGCKVSFEKEPAAYL